MGAYTELTIEATDPAALVRETADMMALQAANARVTVSLALAGDVPPVLVDKVRLRQALLNLLSNAIKFTPERGTVTLATRFDRERERVVVTIADTGIGIAEEHIRRSCSPSARFRPGGVCLIPSPSGNWPRPAARPALRRGDGGPLFVPQPAGLRDRGRRGASDRALARRTVGSRSGAIEY